MTQEDAREFIGWFVIALVICNLVAIPWCLVSIARTLDLIRFATAARTGILVVESSWLRERHEDWKARKAKEKQVERDRVIPEETI